MEEVSISIGVPTEEPELPPKARKEVNSLDLFGELPQKIKLTL